MNFVPPTDDLVDPLAALWHQGWTDGHLDIVPEGLTRLRTLDNFRDRLIKHRARITVALDDGALAGFFMLGDGELDQFYVAPNRRGTGTAQALMAEAETRLLAAGHTRPFLACSVGNTRAARFYEKCGWEHVATEVYDAETSAGTFPLDIWRYEKSLAPVD